MVKFEARREFLQRRIDLAPDQVEGYTTQIRSGFENFDLKAIRFFLSYYPLVSRKEFNVAVCEQVVFNKCVVAKIAWPKTDADAITMEAHLLEEHGLFAKNKYDILEPIGNNTVDPDLLDLVFVPLLAFDHKGFRVGYGKGYYDRYLSRCREDIIKIGFSFFEAIDAIDDINEFDVPLDYCITPSRLYEF
ncbi:MAG: 5-formyltetrahydrofolate cyclo-ligase [Chitinophagaceae bacterium]|nr:MAG: 5-formyltetrahydrofolate cyclo-ligase [Chitinophagaceae bacterium]